MQSRIRSHDRVLVALLAILVVATGIPWSEIHAHPDHVSALWQEGAAGHDDEFVVHLEQHHSDGLPGGESHAHEHGLFANSPAAAVSESSLPVPLSEASEFADPSLPPFHSLTSPLLRPPARP